MRRRHRISSCLPALRPLQPSALKFRARLMKVVPCLWGRGPSRPARRVRQPRRRRPGPPRLRRLRPQLLPHQRRAQRQLSGLRRHPRSLRPSPQCALHLIAPQHQRCPLSRPFCRKAPHHRCPARLTPCQPICLQYPQRMTRSPPLNLLIGPGSWLPWRPPSWLLPGWLCGAGVPLPHQWP